MNLKVYLARPISGSSTSDVIEWYESVAGCLLDIGHTPLTPLVNEGEFRNDTKFSGFGYVNVPTASNHAIFGRDQWLVRQSDVILADLSDAVDRVSIGCVMELGWASMLGKHTIVVLSPRNIHEHAFVLEAADVVFYDLLEALDYIKRLGGPND